MSLIKWKDNIAKKFKWFDIKLAQLVAIFAILTLITAWPGFLNLILKFEWYWYLIITVILGIPLLKKIFF